MLPRKTAYEYVNSFCLSALGKTVTVFPFLRGNQHHTIILCYHSVANTQWRFASSVQDFREQMLYLKQHFTLISLSELVAGKPGVAITFDDGYEDNFTQALPILKEYNIPATVFLLGEPELRDAVGMNNSYPLLTTKQIQELKKSGWEIGFHTQTHANLRQLDDAKLAQEITEGKKKLEEKLGFPLSYFSYPFGLFSSAAVQHVQDAGFTHAFTINGGVPSNKHPLLIARVGVEGTLSLLQFGGLVSPIGVMMNHIFLTLLQWKVRLRGKI